MSAAGRPAFGRVAQGFGGYTVEELTETARLTREEDPRWRLVFPVTRGTRDFVIEQMPVLVATYGLANALILAAASVEGVGSPATTRAWLLEAVVSIVARVLLIRQVARASPVEVASSIKLRLLPLGAIALAAVHWSWTAALFIGPQLDLTTVVVLLTYVMLSIACVGMAPATPAISGAYLVPMWGATTWMLATSNWASGSVLLALAAALAGVLWCGFYVVISGVRRYLVRSDEVDLLMRELRERNGEVELLRAAAASDLETRAAVFASASHDLRQRIHALKLLAHASADTATAASPARRMASVIDELESFATDVLNFVRFDTGSKAKRLSIVPLQEVLQNIELQFEAMTVQRNVRLRTRATKLCLRTDTLMLGRVLENLVSNAVKFTRRDVLVVARRRADEVMVEVWDQGTGLDPRRMDGDAFRCSERGQQATGEGFGLGLTIVRTLVDALGYRLEVSSRAMRGTRVRILIPVLHVVPEGET